LPEKELVVDKIFTSKRRETNTKSSL